MGVSRGRLLFVGLKSGCLKEIVKSKLAGATKSHGGHITQTSVVEIFRCRYLASLIISSRKRTPTPRSNRPGIFMGFPALVGGVFCFSVSSVPEASQRR